MSALDAITRMGRVRIDEMRAQSRIKCAVTMAEAIATMATPTLFRCYSRRGYTRWRHGINRMKAERLFVAASIFGQVGKQGVS